MVVRLLALGVLLLPLGCRKSEPGGEPSPAATFTLEGPLMAIRVEQGEARTITLKVRRGKEFKQSLRLKFEPPRGMVVAMSEVTLRPLENDDVHLRVAVDSDAPPGNHSIHVTAMPEHGTAAHLDVKLHVLEQKDRVKLTLKTPLAAVVLERGESKTIPISVEPYEKYLAEIKLQADAPTGLSATVTPSSLRGADKGDATLRVQVDRTAAVGDYTIHLTGKAAAAVVAPADVRVRIVAP